MKRLNWPIWSGFVLAWLRDLANRVRFYGGPEEKLVAAHFDC